MIKFLMDIWANMRHCEQTGAKLTVGIVVFSLLVVMVCWMPNPLLITLICIPAIPIAIYGLYKFLSFLVD